MSFRPLPHPRLPAGRAISSEVGPTARAARTSAPAPEPFYRDVIDELLTDGTLRRDMSLLVVCGGATDRSVLQAAGLQDCVISNLDPRADAAALAPFAHGYQDAERLSYEDGAFDFAIVHSGLHHCYSPHRALLEMYRVARRGVLLFEPYDNAISRIGLRLGFSQDYEHAAVFYNDLRFGGVRNSPIPNYVYRWTDREIVKTIKSAAPEGRPRFRFFHRFRVPWGQLRGRRNRAYLWLAILALPALRLVQTIAPRQVNNFAALILKPEMPRDLHPWLRWNETAEIDPTWLERRYGSSGRKDRAR